MRRFDIDPLREGPQGTLVLYEGTFIPYEAYASKIKSDGQKRWRLKNRLKNISRANG